MYTFVGSHGCYKKAMFRQMMKSMMGGNLILTLHKNSKGYVSNIE